MEKPVQRLWQAHACRVQEKHLGKLRIFQWSLLCNKVSPTLMVVWDLLILLLVLLVWGTWKRLSWVVCFDPLDIISESSWGWKTHLQGDSSLTYWNPGATWTLCMASHPQSLSIWLRLLTAWWSQNICASYLAIGFQETRVEVTSLPKA